MQPTWAALKQLGRSGVEELVTRCCDLAVELGALVEASPRLELTAPVATCVTCFRYRPPELAEGEELDELNRRIQQRLAREGSVLATGGMLPSGFSLRPTIVSWRTTSADVALLAREVERLGDELSLVGRPRQRVHPLRGERQRERPVRAGRQRVRDGVCDRCGCADDAGLARALHAERVAGHRVFDERRPRPAAPRGRSAAGSRRARRRAAGRSRRTGSSSRSAPATPCTAAARELPFDERWVDRTTDVVQHDVP